jgi:regulator of protease activity HflC (stomatin/prohibitin superfamily)
MVAVSRRCCIGAAIALIAAASESSVWGVVLSALVAAAAGAGFAGLTVVNPNEAKVVTLFGVYHGSIKVAGFWWVNPLTTRRRCRCACATSRAAS